MKTLITAVSLFILFIAQNLLAKTNVSHAIAMHGEPKYNKDFISVEYISKSAEKEIKKIMRAQKDEKRA